MGQNYQHSCDWYLLSLQESQTVNRLQKRVHDKRLPSAEVVELHGQVLNQLLHLERVLFCVLFLCVKVDDKLARIFDVKDGQVLSLGHVEDGLLVEGPLLFGSEDKKHPAKNEEPEEARHDDRQNEEVLVNEDRLLVPLHFHVHHDNHSEVRDEAEDIEQVCREAPNYVLLSNKISTK